MKEELPSSSSAPHPEQVWLGPARALRDPRPLVTSYSPGQLPQSSSWLSSPSWMPLALPPLAGTDKRQEKSAVTRGRGVSAGQVARDGLTLLFVLSCSQRSLLKMAFSTRLCTENSIQHNMALNKRFIRVSREKGEPGKGGVWKLEPQYADRLRNVASKKQRTTPVQLHQPSSKAQPEAQCIASPAASAPASKNILTVSMESQQLLEEFEEVIGDLNSNPAGHKRKQPSLHSALLSQDEQPELGSLEGDLAGEGTFDTSHHGEFSLFEDPELTPPNNPATGNLGLRGEGQHVGCAQGQEQVLTKSNQNPLEFETLMATSLLQHPWREEAEDDLTNWDNIRQLSEPSRGMFCL
uniref:Fork-head domain-containing protein n=1 Tax=Athene cunicularia TaxID=194338 RepID=A0A663LTB1_ATHCN